MRDPLRLLLSAAALAGLATNPGCTCTDLGNEAQSPGAAPISAPWKDDFDRAEIGADWNVTEPSAYKIESGELVVQMGHNHPAWLKRPLPKDAKVEFDAWSNSTDGDIKIELWGDGKSTATDRYGQYTSTAYNFIFGGWKNQLSTLARLNEHGADRKVRAEPKVEKGRKYHFTIVRKGGRIDWSMDGQPFLEFDDPAPLDGPGHAFLGINNWEAELHFDNLTITPN